MRKSVVLALLLVLAVAGSSLAAAEISWSGEFDASAEYMSGFRAADEAKFFANFGREATASFDIGITDDEDVWSVDFKVKGLVDGDADLGKYTLKVNEDAFQVTAWGKYAATDKTGIGHKGDALELLRLDGTNTAVNPKFRLETNLGGFDLTAQVEERALWFNGETDFDGFDLGVTVRQQLLTPPFTDKPETAFGVYGGADLGIVRLDGAFATVAGEDLDSDKNYGVFGVKASSDITEQLNVEGKVVSSGDAHDESLEFGVGATYTEGLLRFGVDYDAANFHDTNKKQESTVELAVNYRGSADNNDFDDLFGGKYADNVAFAFGGSYTVNQNIDDAPASELKLNAAGPVVQDQFWLRGQVTMAQNTDGFTDEYRFSDLIAPVPAAKIPGVKNATAVVLDGTAKVGEKLQLKPHIASRSWTFAGDVQGTSLRLELGASYALTDAATLSAHFGQETIGQTGLTDEVNRYNGFGITVEF